MTSPSFHAEQICNAIYTSRVLLQCICHGTRWFNSTVTWSVEAVEVEDFVFTPTGLVMVLLAVAAVPVLPTRAPLEEGDAPAVEGEVVWYTGCVFAKSINAIQDLACLSATISNEQPMNSWRRKKGETIASMRKE